MSYATKEIKRLLGKAIHTRQMIRDGDHILVAVSGGKDSLSLLCLLRERLKRIPIAYQLTAVHVDPGFAADSGSQMTTFFEANKYDYRIIRSDIGPRAHGPENRENPCFLCSRLRRKLLFETARELGCSKIAFGHHKDDLIETFFLNVYYGASISTMKPVQEFFKGNLTVIRPLYLLDEQSIRQYAEEMGWPMINMGCPSSGSSQRAAIKQQLQELYRTNRKIKGNIFHALHNVRLDYLL
ncbi:MAG: tRNA 2-thiocytidine(32) synthetase TtcA [Desulfobacteraceae bacterium]|nr:MAG: tRNA 2-thiocytidine(32) synthetase TtcA [Desulfobacteraceae bacterium]